MPKLALMFFSRSKGSADTQPRSLLASCRACSILGSATQNADFAPAVAGHNVGAPAIGLQDLPDALENEVALKVPVEIVYEFEAVEVHEHQGKRAPRSSGPLPFGGQCFTKKTMRLHARESVGDRLFLRLLERKRVVQRAGDEVGQGAQQKNFFLGEVHRYGRF